MPPHPRKSKKISLRPSQARLLADGPAKKTVSIAWLLLLSLAFALSAAACWFFRADIAAFWQPKIKAVADQPAKIQAAARAAALSASPTPADEQPHPAPPNAPTQNVAAWKVDFPAVRPLPAAPPKKSAAPIQPTAPDPHRLPSAYQKACEEFNAALHAYNLVRHDASLIHQRDEAEQHAENAVKMFSALNGKFSDPDTLSKHLADASSLLHEIRSLHRFLTVDPSSPATSPRPMATRTAPPTRTLPKTPTRTAPHAPTRPPTPSAPPVTPTAKPTMVVTPDYSR